MGEHLVQWYNGEHLRSAIAYVTPNEQHNGEAEAQLKKRSRHGEILFSACGVLYKAD